ncbi:AI-2E family transporter [Palleronia sp.]|uniref:AI-2E family transporter n=1 Tax=Palleronia sp. TaxID=1940284 RepID=UPI0035C7DBB6
MESDQVNRLQTAANIALIVAGVVAIFWALYVAQSVFAPTMLAFVFGVVLSPLSDFWERLGLKRGLSALLSLVLTLFLIVLIAGLALPVADRLIDAWPTILTETRAFIFDFQVMLQGIESAGEEVRQAVSGSGENGGGSEGSAIAIPTTADALFLAPSVLGQTITFAGVLFFFLLTRNDVYAWIAQHVAPADLETETAYRLKQAEREVARYFLTISVVNAGFGICTSIAMLLLGVPAPLLWGAAVFVLNFILYLGPALIFAGLLLTGLIVFDGSYSFVPALVFLGLNLIEAQFVTPSAIGRTMRVNPLLIFFALVFFLWLWGPLGGFVAIPTLLWGLSLTKEFSATRKDVRDAVRVATEEPHD